MLFIDSTGCTKIDEFDNGVLLVLKVDVLRLNITMHDIALMQVVNSREKLFNHIGSLDLIEVLISGDTFIQ